MEADRKIFDPEFVIDQILGGRSDEEIVAAMVHRGSDAKTAKEFVEGLRKTLGRTPMGESRTRDKHLQRLLLLSTLERKERPELSEYSQAQRAYNAALLINDGLAEGATIRGPRGEYVQATLLELTSAGHDFLERAQGAQPAEGALRTPTPSKLVFVSHSAADGDIALAVLNLICAALHLRKSDFICTSVDGARLQGGADTDQVLRRAIREVPSFLSILTAKSMESTYVLFELGARWGCEKHHIPLLAKGAGPDVLKEPLKAKNALQLSREAECHQLVQELATHLGRELQPTQAYLQEVQQLVSVAALTTVPQKSREAEPTPRHASGLTFRLHTEIRIATMFNTPSLILAAWLANDGSATANEVKIQVLEAPIVPAYDKNNWASGPSGLIVSKNPIHPKEMPCLANWHLGQAKVLVDGIAQETKVAPTDPEQNPIHYVGADIVLRLKIFSRDQAPVELDARIAKEDIRRLRPKDFPA